MIFIEGGIILENRIKLFRPFKYDRVISYSGPKRAKIRKIINYSCYLINPKRFTLNIIRSLTNRYIYSFNISKA